MQLREGETVGDYVSRLEARLRELEPPEGFTIQEWHVGQVYCYMLWMEEDVREGGEAMRKWHERLTMFENRFSAQCKKFADYMGWPPPRKNLQKSPTET